MTHGAAPPGAGDEHQAPNSIWRQASQSGEAREEREGGEKGAGKQAVMELSPLGFGLISPARATPVRHLSTARRTPTISNVRSRTQPNRKGTGETGLRTVHVGPWDVGQGDFLGKPYAIFSHTQYTGKAEV